MSPQASTVEVLKLSDYNIAGEISWGGSALASLILAEAEQILAAAKAKVLDMGAKMSVSVVDPRGDLIVMFRTDGASWRTPPISRAKVVNWRRTPKHRSSAG